jgi:hypothetical protein
MKYGEKKYNAYFIVVSLSFTGPKTLLLNFSNQAISLIYGVVLTIWLVQVMATSLFPTYLPTQFQNQTSDKFE